MSTILNRIRSHGTAITPHSVPDLFALALSARLSDSDNYPKYLQLASNYPYIVLADAVRRLEGEARAGAAYDSLESELQRGSFGGVGQMSPVVGVRIQRRVIALVSLERGSIEHTEVRELSSDGELAIRTATGFFRKALEWARSATFVIETLPEGADFRRVELIRAMFTVLREAGIPIWEVDRAQILASYGLPPPKTLPALRQVVSGIFPTLANGPLRNQVLLEAVAAAIHVYIIRHFQPDLETTDQRALLSRDSSS